MFATFVLNVDVCLDSTFEEVLDVKSTNATREATEATLGGHPVFLENLEVTGNDL